MKFRKILYALAGTLMIGGLLASCGQQTSSAELIHPHKLTIGLTGTGGPYSYESHGKMVGFESDLARDVAKKMGLKPKFVTTKWDSLIAGLGSRRYDVIFNNITPTKSRKKSFLFSKPYIYSRDVMVTKNNEPNLKNVKSIKGQKFAEGTGTDNAMVANRFGAKVVPSDAFQTSITLMRQGRAKGTINSQAEWNFYGKKRSTKGLRAKLIPTSEQPYSDVEAMFGKSSPKLRAKVSKAIQQLRKDGTLKKLSLKYFGVNITNKK